MIEGEVDFGLESGYDRIDGLEYTPLVIDRYGLVCRSDLPLARGKGPLRWSQLPQAGYVGFSADTGIGRFLRRHAGHWPVLAQPHDEVTSTTSLFALLSNGPRYSVVPAMALRDDEFPHLAYRQLSDPPLSREICLITRRLRALSPNAERLLDAIRTSVQLAKLPRGAKVAEGFKPPARRR